MRFFGVILIFIGIPLCIVPLIGVPVIIIGLFMVIAGFGSANANKTAKALAKQMGTMQQQRQAAPAPAANNGDAEKWAALAKYDDDVRKAVEQLQPLGAAAVNKLRTTYLALNDKTKLAAIVADVQSEFTKQAR